MTSSLGVLKGELRPRVPAGHIPVTTRYQHYLRSLVTAARNVSSILAQRVFGCRLPFLRDMDVRRACADPGER